MPTLPCCFLLEAQQLTLTRNDIETIRKLAVKVGSSDKADRLAGELAQMLEYVETRQEAERKRTSKTHPE